MKKNLIFYFIILLFLIRIKTMSVNSSTTNLDEKESNDWQDLSDWFSGDGPDYKVYTIKKNNVYYTGDDNPEVISFKRTFNSKLDSTLINTLSKYSYVMFDQCFNQNIDSLPDNIRFLELGAEFNQKVNKWPKSLETLRFSAWDYFSDGYCKFNHKLEGLPNIKHLKLGTFYNHPIDDLPDSIETLYIERSSHLEHPINKLPKNLKRIHLGRYGRYNKLNVKPVNVTVMHKDDY